MVQNDRHNKLIPHILLVTKVTGQIILLMAVETLYNKKEKKMTHP